MEVGQSNTKFDDLRWVRTLPSERVLILRKLFRRVGFFSIGGKKMQRLSKENIYQIYTENIRYANYQLEVIRCQARQLAGEYYWYISKGKESQIRRELINELKAVTNLYAYILGNRFELQLMKILHESSSAAFSETELENIKKKGTIYDKWFECIHVSFAKSKCIDWTDIDGINLLELFQDQKNYLKDFQEIITMRNRLAHGQWSTQLNSNGTQEITLNALDKYNDISKLVLLSKKLDIMVQIVETIVVYKDKYTKKFKEKLSHLIEENRINDCRIEKSSLSTYVKREVKVFDKKKSQKKFL